MSRRIAVLSLAGLTAFAVAASAFPLAVYTVALACFGMPHVLAELRYVDRRFGRRLDRGFIIVAAGLLALIVLTRASVALHVLPPDIGVPLELALAASLAVACAKGGLAQRLTGLCVGAAIATATLIAPFATMVGFSILHNFTPLGFLWQISADRRRRGVMAFGAVAFFVIPLAVALGAPRAIFGAEVPALDPLGAGPLAAHLGVYVPEKFLDAAAARDLFSAAVAAQGAHYLCVIVILPAMLRRFEPSAEGLLSWPKERIFGLLCAATSAFAAAAFGRDFLQSRAIYGIAAALHAWIEIPILIIALTSDELSPIKRPRRKEPEFAASETSMARPSASIPIQQMSAPSTTTTAASSDNTAGQ